MKKLQYIALFFIFTSTAGLAQQIGMYSDYTMNRFYYNPAYAGSQELLTLNAAYRKQWVGFEGAPSDFHFDLVGSVKNQGKIGYGIGLFNQSSGLMNTTGFRLNYAQHIRISKNVKLGLGIQPGYFQYRIRLYDAKLADVGDHVLTGNVHSTNAFDVNAGFNLYSKKFFVMAAFQRIFGKNIKFTGFNSQLQFHFNAMAGYNFDLKKQKLRIQPSIFVRYTKPVPIQLSAMIKVRYDDKYSIGVMYRNNDAIGINAGFTFKKRYTISYGYDIQIGNIRKYNSGSHEIILSLILNKKKPTLEDLDEKLNNSILENANKKKNSKQ